MPDLTVQLRHAHQYLYTCDPIKQFRCVWTLEIRRVPKIVSSCMWCVDCRGVQACSSPIKNQILIVFKNFSIRRLPVCQQKQNTRFFRNSHFADYDNIINGILKIPLILKSISIIILYF